MIAILGASGYIGNHIFNYLKRDDFSVMGTYFKNNKNDLSYFDLESMSPNAIDLDNRNIQFMIICSAVNVNIDDTKREWGHSYNINVEKVKGVIDFCFDNGIIPVYLSTDNVFDGEKGNYREDDKKNPINGYGQIRNEVENFLIGSNKNFVVLRMGKVFGFDLNDGTMITSMLKDMKANKQVFYSDDQVIAPICIEDLYIFVKFIITNNLTGIYHLASIEPTTRYEISNRLMRFFNFNNSTVAPCKINSLNLLERRPLLIDLNDCKFRNIIKTKRKDLTYYLKLISR